MKLSTKKTIAVIGSVVMFIIALYATYKDPTLAPSILISLSIYCAALFGIKKYGGNVSTNIEGK